MTGDGYTTSAADLTAHASTVNGLVDELRGALGTAGQATLTDDAYGQTGQPAGAMLNAVANAGQQTLQAAIDALESVATNLRANAAAYADQETGTSGTLTSITGRLG